VYLFLRLNGRSVAHLARVTSLGHLPRLSHTAPSCTIWTMNQNGRPSSVYLRCGSSPLYCNQTLLLAYLAVPCETAS